MGVGISHERSDRSDHPIVVSLELGCERTEFDRESENLDGSHRRKNMWTWLTLDEWFDCELGA